MKTQNTLDILFLAMWQYECISILLLVAFTLPIVGNVAKVRLPGCQVANHLCWHGELLINTNANAPSWPFYSSSGCISNGVIVHSLPQEAGKIGVIFAVLVSLWRPYFQGNSKR